MTISGTIEQAPKDAYYFTDVLQNDIVFRGLNNACFCWGTGSNVLSSLRVNSNIVSMSAATVGIGTSSPQSSFHVYNGTGSPVLLLDGGALGNRGAIRMTTTNTGNFIQSGIQLSNDSKADLIFTSMNGTTEWMRIRSASGNVGIGNINPLFKLDVTGTINASSNIISTQVLSPIISSTSSTLSIAGDNTVSTINVGCTSNTQTINIGTTQANSIINIGGPTNRVNISGTLYSVNSVDLTVNDKLITLNKGGTSSSGGGAGIEIEENSNVTSYIKTSSDRNSFLFKTPTASTDLSMNLSGGKANFNNGVLVLNTNNTVGLGTDASVSKLDVVGGATVNSVTNVVSQFRVTTTSGVNDAGVVIGSTNGTSPFIGDNNSSASLGLSFLTKNIQRMFINSNGKIGIGTTIPSQDLDINGNLQVHGSNSGTMYFKNTNRATQQWYISGPRFDNLQNLKFGFVMTDSNTDVTVMNLRNVASGQQYGVDVLGTFSTSGDIISLSELKMRNGNTPGAGTLNQLSMAYTNTDNYKHSIKTRHHATVASSNGLDFYLWSPGQGVTATGCNMMLSMTGTGVGVNGVAYPGYTLDVNGSINASNMYLNGVSINSIGNLNLSFWVQRNSGNWTGCNVAIGSSDVSPYNLNVYGSAYIAGKQSLSASNQGTHINWNDDGSTGKTQLINSRGAGTGGYTFDMWNNSGYLTTPLLIDGNGKIGMNTLTPTQQLDVRGTITSIGSGTSYTGILLQNTSVGANPEIAGVCLDFRGYSMTTGLSARIRSSDGTNGSYGGTLMFSTKSASSTDADTLVERVRINETGNVGIGTTLPANKLDIFGGDISVYNGSNALNNGGKISFGISALSSALGPMATIEGKLHYANSSYNALSGGLSFNVRANNSNVNTTLSEIMRIDQSGNVGIGTTTPTYKLDINGNTRLRLGSTLRIEGTSSATSTNVLSIGANGQLSVDTGAASGGRFIVKDSGNVGVGTTNPTSKLQVNGSLAKVSGTFDIPHPTLSNKRLVHSFIEGPRCDLIYRGKVQLQNGVAKVDLDKDCVHDANTCAMTPGTFSALCTNPQFFLQNTNGFDKVIGNINEKFLIIQSENSESSNVISWMVVAERHDKNIKSWERTNDAGYLMTEYNL